jgi:hypothetical protein
MAASLGVVTLDGMTTGEIRSLTSVMADNGCISWRRYLVERIMVEGHVAPLGPLRDTLDLGLSDWMIAEPSAMLPIWGMFWSGSRLKWSKGGTA